MSSLCHKQTSRPIDQGLTAWSSTADSFEDEAIDDAANRALLCEVGSDQAVEVEVSGCVASTITSSKYI
jgi:hypothetical protein